MYRVLYKVEDVVYGDTANWYTLETGDNDLNVIGLCLNVTEGNNVYIDTKDANQAALLTFELLEKGYCDLTRYPAIICDKDYWASDDEVKAFNEEREKANGLLDAAGALDGDAIK